jgi:hypothetical protein
MKASSGGHPALYTVSTAGSILGVMRQGPEANHLPPSNAEGMNNGSIIIIIIIIIIICGVGLSP